MPNGAPEGIANGMAWDCLNVDFPAGGVRTRPGLKSQFPTLTGNAYVNYLKTFPTLLGVDRLLVFDSLGNFYKENPTGTLELVINRLAENAVCQSQTQFGREYLAFSDGKVGIDLPRQFDDTYFDRVSQVGPGAAPTVADLVSSWGIATNGIQCSATTISAIAQNGEYVTVTVPNGNLPPFPQVGDAVSVGGQLFTISSFSNANNSFTFQAPAGYVLPAVGTAVTFSQAVVTLSRASGTVFQVGNLATIAGATDTTWDGTYIVRATTDGGLYVYLVAQAGVTQATGTGGGTLGAAGTISQGTHQVSVSFVTRQGYWTRPSPPVTWTAAGGYAADVSGIPVGPSNVVARVLMFTPAGQSGAPSFYTIATATGLPGAATAMLIQDNTTTQASVNFSDTELLAATSCGYLFDLIELPEQAGVVAYGDRLFWWGERNGIWSGKNGVWNNLTFDGGWSGNVPLGWAADAVNGAGGSPVLGPAAWADPSPVVWGDAYRITGDGVTAIRGMITQSAVKDYNSVPLLSPNTAYSVRARVLMHGLANSEAVLNIDVSSDLFHTTQGAALVTGVNASEDFYTEYTAQLMSTEWATIPSDLVLRVYVDSTPTDGGYFQVDNIEIYETAQGDGNGSILRCSRVNDPESYDGVQGLMQVSPNDGQRITNAFVLRNNLYIVKERSFYVTADDGVNEPALWSVEQVSNKVGTPSVHGVAATNEAAVIAGRDGIYVFTGSPPEKVSQEIQTDQRNLLTGAGPVWDQVNWAAAQRMWVAIQADKKRVLVGAPMGSATLPNYTLALYYPYESTSLADVTIFRKYKDAPLARSWAPWSIAANCAALIQRPDNSMPLFLGSNDGTGRIFALTEGYFEDDGAVIPAYYATYFVNGSDLGLPPVGRKLFGYLRINGEGQGTLVVAGFPVANRTVEIATAKREGNLTAITTETPHGLYKNQFVDIQGVADASYNGQFPVLGVYSATEFIYANQGTDGESTGGTVTPILGTLELSSPALGGNLELPVNVSAEMLSIRFGIPPTGNPGDWFSISQRVEVYLKLDPWAPFGSN